MYAFPVHVLECRGTTSSHAVCPRQAKRQAQYKVCFKDVAAAVAVQTAHYAVHVSCADWQRYPSNNLETLHLRVFNQGRSCCEEEKKKKKMIAKVTGVQVSRLPGDHTCPAPAKFNDASPNSLVQDISEVRLASLKWTAPCSQQPLA